MDLKYAPVSLGSISTDPINVLLLTIVAVVAVVLFFGARREIATLAIAAGVIGAIMVT